MTKKQELHSKVIVGLERISEAFKTLLWSKAKAHGISPIQIQILLFLSQHKQEFGTVSHLAQEFDVSKPTISDATRVLANKNLISKDHSSPDSRSFFFFPTPKGQKLIKDLVEFSEPIDQSLKSLDNEQLEQLFASLSKLIYQLNRQGIIQVQRTCFACKYYSFNNKEEHHCGLLKRKLLSTDIRLDCPEFEVKA